MAPDPVGLPAETVLAWRQLCFFMWLLGRFNVGFGMPVFISSFAVLPQKNLVDTGPASFAFVGKIYSFLVSRSVDLPTTSPGCQGTEANSLVHACCSQRNDRISDWLIARSFDNLAACIRFSCHPRGAPSVWGCRYGWPWEFWV
jgi:hypothetical protein